MTQVWDIGQPAPEEVGRNYDIMLASNVLHTAPNIASAPTSWMACTLL